MILMHKDVPTLYFSPDEYLVKVINNDFLPFALKDNLVNSENIKSVSEGMKNYDKIRHFFADRTLSLSRENAKQILQSIQNKQNLTEEERYRLSVKCRGISTNDCFWVKEDDEDIKFKNVDIRSLPLSDVAFQVAMNGESISIQHSLLMADISTKGMFRKTWIRENGELYLLKSDKTSTFINTKSEIDVSNYLKDSSINHIDYSETTKEGLLCCKCKCYTSDNISFVESEYVKDYIERKNESFKKYINDNFKKDFANMVVCDYIFANPDRHCDNWGFQYNPDTNKITGLFPLFDNNQALIALILDKEKQFDEIIYDPTEKTIKESAIEWYPYSDVKMPNAPEFALNRLNTIKALAKNKQKENFCER